MSSSSSTSSGFERDAPLQTRKRKRRDAVEFGEVNEQSTQEDDEPTPALSHAERRRRKKKALSGMKDASPRAAPPAKKRKTGINSLTIDSAAVAATAKRQNSVWVGNLSFKTTAENLKTFFEGVGEITRIHMPTKAGGTEIRGSVLYSDFASGISEVKLVTVRFAYVDFATPDSKVVAITLSEKHLLGRRLLIKDGTGFTSFHLEYGLTNRPIPHRKRLYRSPDNTGRRYTSSIGLVPGSVKICAEDLESTETTASADAFPRQPWLRDNP
jgi:hypothetical protein